MNCDWIYRKEFTGLECQVCGDKMYLLDVHHRNCSPGWECKGPPKEKVKIECAVCGACMLFKEGCVHECFKAKDKAKLPKRLAENQGPVAYSENNRRRINQIIEYLKAKEEEK